MTLGTKLLGDLAAKHPDELPRDVLQRVLTEAGGNVSRTVRALKAGGIKANRQSLLGAIEAVGLRSWLEEAYPTRERGGRTREEVPAELVAKIRKGLDGYGLTTIEGTVLTKRFHPENPWTLEELAGNFGISREAVRRIEQRALRKIERA